MEQMKPNTSKLVWAPMADKQTSDDEEPKVGFRKIGIRVQLENDEWWFWSLRHSTWTRHLPGMPVLYRNNRPTGEIGPERKMGPYRGDGELVKRLGHCVSLVATLITLRNEALEEE